MTQQVIAQARLVVLLLLITSAYFQQLEPSLRQNNSVQLQIDVKDVISAKNTTVIVGYSGIEYCGDDCVATRRLKIPIYKDTMTQKTVTTAAVTANTDLRIVAGFQDGSFAVYSKDSQGEVII